MSPQSSLNRPSFRYPFTLPEGLDPDVRRALEFCFNGVTNHEQAFAALKPQLDSTVAAANAAAASSSSSSVAGVSSFNSETGDVIYFPTLGTVNDQLGAASYATQQSDNGAKIIVGDSSAVAVTLNNTITAPWFAVIDNDSTGIAELTPGAGAGLFGPPAIQPGGFGIVFFDGVNFWCGATGVMPQNTPQVLGEYLVSYDSSSGVFGQASLPIATDSSLGISRPDGVTIVATAGVLSTIGATGTIPLGPLTDSGATGSITVLDGLIMSFVSPT